MKNPAELLDDLNVAIYQDAGLKYPREAPYSPHIGYPEYHLKHIAKEENYVYDAMRQNLLLLGLDRENFGTPHWNPFKNIIHPGDKVVIKPNFVLDRHDEGGDLFSIITHPSVIRAVIDYVCLALQGQGKIIIADAPQMDCDFDNLLKKTGLRYVQELYKRELGFELEIYDLRDFWYDVKKAGATKAAYTEYRFKLPGDPQGRVVVSLGKESLFCGINSRNFYGADYNRREVICYHNGEVQEYLMSKTVLSADVVILLPKLKVHKKVGVTLNVKGLVGTVVNKNCLVHYRLGTPSEGGDQFPEGILSKKERMAVKLERRASDLPLSHRHTVTDKIYELTARVASPFFRRLGLKMRSGSRLLDAGNWYGNDSAWRMAVDLLRIFLYADQEGKLHNTPIRRVVSIIDGVIGGEENGPLAPASKKSGVLIAGFNPCAVDIVGARLMGFDFNKIRMLSYLVAHPEFFKTNIARIIVRSNQSEFDGLLRQDNRKRYLDFEAPPGWKGVVEV